MFLYKKVLNQMLYFGSPSELLFIVLVIGRSDSQSACFLKLRTRFEYYQLDFAQF